MLISNIGEQMNDILRQKQCYSNALYRSVTPSVVVYASKQVNKVYVILILL